MRSDQVPEGWGLCSLVSRDLRTLGVSYGPTAYAVGQLMNPIPPREWERILMDEWAKPEVEGESAIVRAVLRAGEVYGLAGLIRAEPICSEIVLLGDDVSE